MVQSSIGFRMRCFATSLSLIVPLALAMRLDAAEFFCSSGNVTCLIGAINDANKRAGKHIINLEPGPYTLQAVDNATDGPNGLPSIKRAIQIRAATGDMPTFIEADPSAPLFRIFHVSVSGELRLEGVTVRRGFLGLFEGTGGAIFNRGMTILRDSFVTDSFVSAGTGAIHNIGTLNVFRTIITNNHTGSQGGGVGGIFNEPGGTVVVEKSTISYNGGGEVGAGGIGNQGSLILRDSAVVFNASVPAVSESSGGGISNGGSLEIVNSTIAKNIANRGAAIANFGMVSITNSTIRENEPYFDSPNNLGSVYSNAFSNGPVRLQNTIVAGNSIDCSGTVMSLGNNLFGDPSGCTVSLQPTDLTEDPGLGGLVGTGDDDLPGRVYYPILQGSIAIGAANSKACPKDDQLGNRRDRPCDIGSIEFSTQSDRIIAQAAEAPN
jgi:hypothetical protein